MDIVIISNFCMDFSDKDNDRFLYIAKQLTDKHDVEIITSDFYHTKKRKRNTPANKWPFKITFLHESGYPRNVCLKRFYSHFIWGLEVRKYLKQRKKPDVIYCAVPSLTGPYVAARYCSKNAVKFIIDVQDLWPEAFQMVFNVPILSSFVFLPFRFLANGIYKSADEIVAVSKTYVDRAIITNSKYKNALAVFLGTDLNDFDRYANKKAIMEKNTSEIWIGYCGTLGSSYDLSNAIKAIAKTKRSDIRFIIMGDGPLMDKFRVDVEKEGIKATFTGRLSYDEMVALLCRCDIAINPIMHGAAQSIINKHSDYVASGLPIISTQESKEFQNLINSYHMGINCDNDNVEEISEAIIKLADDPELRKKLGSNARKCAEEKFDRKNSYLEVLNLICKE